MEEQQEEGNVLNEKPSKIELLAFDKNHTLQYQGVCTIAINAIENIMEINLEKRDVFEIPLKFYFINVKNMLCIVAPQNTADMALIFSKEAACKKVHTIINKFMTNDPSSPAENNNDRDQEIFNDRFLSPLLNQIGSYVNMNHRMKDVIQDLIKGPTTPEALNVSKPENESTQELETLNNVSFCSEIKFEPQPFQETSENISSLLPRIIELEPINGFNESPDLEIFESASSVKDNSLLLEGEQNDDDDSLNKIKECIDNVLERERRIENDEAINGSDIEYYSPQNDEGPPFKKLKLSRNEFLTPPQTKIIPSSEFEMLKFDGHGMNNAILTIFVDTTKTHCYYLGWNKRRKYFYCSCCLKNGLNIQVKLIKNDQEFEWLEQNHIHHQCIPLLYKPYIKEEKCVKKENYVIMESTTLKGSPGRDLYIFDKEEEKIMCRKLNYNSKYEIYFCSKCLNKGLYVMALICKNSLNGEEYVQNGNNDHICSSESYDLIYRKWLKKNICVPKPTPKSWKKKAEEQNMIRNEFENKLIQPQEETTKNILINNPFYSPNIYPQINNLPYCRPPPGMFFQNKYFSGMPPNNYQFGMNNINYSNVLPGNNNHSQVLNNNYYYNPIFSNGFNGVNNINVNMSSNQCSQNGYNFYDSRNPQIPTFANEIQSKMTFQLPIMQQQQAPLNNSFNGISPTKFLNTHNIQTQNQQQPLSRSIMEIQSEKPPQASVMQNQAKIPNAFNNSPVNGYPTTNGFGISAPQQNPVLQPNTVIPIHEFSNAHDFEIRYQCMPPVCRASTSGGASIASGGASASGGGGGGGGDVSKN